MALLLHEQKHSLIEICLKVHQHGGLDKEDVYICTMEYYSAIKREWTWLICFDVDGPRDCPIQ